MSTKNVHRKCLLCGADFLTYQFTIDRGHGKYCSRACRQQSFVLKRRRPLAERFAEKVDVNGPVPAHCPELGPCHVWTASRNPLGYGYIGVGSEEDGTASIELAHRVAFFLARGRWPEPCALHRCDGGTIGCVRVDHLYEGTRATNNAEMTVKGRHGMARLTAEEVRAIRDAYAATGNAYEVGRQFGINGEHAMRIIKRLSWKHIA